MGNPVSFMVLHCNGIPFALSWPNHTAALFADSAHFDPQIIPATLQAVEASMRVSVWS